ncbi:HAMP domain-containing protein [Terrilactibacillus sp. S3-3]|nr:HAMP domain-containing protein [Terrilactibacillus sp. S3-3]
MSRRVVLYFMAVVILTLALGETALAIAVQHYYYDGIEKTLLLHAETSNDLYQKFNKKVVINRWENPYVEVMDSFQVHDAALQLLDMQGNVVMSSSGFSEKQPVRLGSRILNREKMARVEVLPQTGEKVIAVYFPITVNQQPYVLSYLSSLASVDHVLLLINIGAVIVGLFIAFFVFLISLRLAHSIVYPLKQIIQVSTKMAEGNFGLRMKEDYKAELGDLSRTLNNMAAEIQKNERLKNEFISSVSHELLTPLTSIKGWSETMLLDKKMNRSELKEGLTVIKKKTNRID